MNWLVKCAILIVGCYTTVDCQTLTCNYEYAYSNQYVCNLTISYPSEFDDYDRIEGTHMANLGDLDVYAVNFTDTTTILPKILCIQFKNLRDIYLENNKLQRITETSVVNCKHLLQIDARNNPIMDIHQDAFKNNPKFKNFHATYTQLTSLPETLFEHNPELKYFYFYANSKFSSMPPNIFKFTPLIYFLYLYSNDLHEWNAAWFQQENIAVLDLYDNKINSIPKNALNSVNIETLDISYNSITELNSESFGELQSLEDFYIDDNPINAIDIRILNRARDLKVLGAQKLACVDKNFPQFDVNREANMEELRPCFEAFGIVNRGEVARKLSCIFYK